MRIENNYDTVADHRPHYGLLQRMRESPPNSAPMQLPTSQQACTGEHLCPGPAGNNMRKRLARSTETAQLHCHSAYDANGTRENQKQKLLVQAKARPAAAMRMAPI